MSRKPQNTSDLASIHAERVRLEAMLADILNREKLAREAERDVGRGELIAALSKVKIGRMSPSDAKAIAQAVAKHGGSEVVKVLATLD